MKSLILLFSILITSIAHAKVIKEDTLRIEFIDDKGVETIDLNRKYKEEKGKLVVEVNPEKVNVEKLDEDKPSVIWKVDLQAGTVSVISNFSQIPGDTGTEFNIDGKTISNYRLYLSSLIKDKHQIRLLYAPLEYSTTINPSTNILFKDSIFLAGVDAEAFYKFNSYRLSYIYHFDSVGAVRFRLGFTAKIRDAETSLTQGQNSQSFKNIGFVPLIHLGARIALTKRWVLDGEVEGSWAPQGYAFDNRLSLNYQVTDNLALGLGAGYLDGGANVSTVNTFAQLFYGFGIITYTFPVKKKKRRKGR